MGAPHNALSARAEKREGFMPPDAVHVGEAVAWFGNARSPDAAAGYGGAPIAAKAQKIPEDRPKAARTVWPTHALYRPRPK
jgi:hypothetical protein